MNIYNKIKELFFLLITVLSSNLIIAQHLIFETTNAPINEYGDIDVADLVSGFLGTDIYSTTNFPKSDGWELVAVDGTQYYYQKTGTTDYGKIEIYDSVTKSITNYNYLSAIFDTPSNWTLAGVDNGLLYFKSGDINTQIVTYDGTTVSEFGYLNDFLFAPAFWDVRGAYNGKIYLQWIKNNTFPTTIKTWDGVSEVLSYAVTDFYDDAFDANIVGVTLTNGLIPENISKISPYRDEHYARGDFLRVFKLAISVTGNTGEYFGSINAVKAELDPWVEALNDLYGRELAVRFELVLNNDDLIFTDGDTDPWEDFARGQVCSTILPVQQSTFDVLVDPDDYDICHVIHNVQGGGCTGIGNLYRGTTGRFTNAGRHEIGHQLGQPHTVGNSTESNYEQGGGWTTQGGNGNPFLHSTSYHISARYLNDNFADIGERIPTGNTIPSINAGLNYTIPISTPFILTADSIDPDADNELTYVWDSMNPWTPHSIPREDDLQGGLFKRFFPSTIDHRYFPTIDDIIANNNTTIDEQLPTQVRTMDFRVSVNDNNTMLYKGEIIKASGINSDDVTIEVADAGPFVVTSQDTNGIVYDAGTTQVVTWEVNNTDVAPINATDVIITMSLDGGYTYPIVLTNSTPNTGSATVTIPNIPTNLARIRVQPVDNIFFDINTNNFTIEENVLSNDDFVDNYSNAIKVFPVPTDEELSIKYPNTISCSNIKIYTITGVLINELSLDPTAQIHNLNVGALQNGLYFLILSHNKGITVKELLIQK